MRPHKWAREPMSWNGTYACPRTPLTRRRRKLDGGVLVVVEDVRVTVLARGDVDAYRRDGFMLLKEAFPRPLALRCRDLLWAQIDEDPADSSTWTRPVVRVGSQTDPAFSHAVQSPQWVEAIIELAGVNADPTPWMGGTFAIRFPVDADRGDDGWHIEGQLSRHRRSVVDELLV